MNVKLACRKRTLKKLNSVDSFACAVADMNALELDERYPTLNLDNLQVPDDDFMPLCWKNLVTFLVGKVKELTKTLCIEQERGDKRNIEISLLQEQVVTLGQDLKASKQWEAVLYAEMQKLSAYNQQVNSKIDELQNYWHKYSAVQTEKGFSESKTRNEDINMKTSEPVIYGDSALSKKLNARKRLKVKDDKAIEVIPVGTASCDIDNSTDLHVNPTDIEMTGSKNVTTRTVKHFDNNEVIDEKSIAETLAEAAKSVIQHSGLTYDDNSGLYYDWNSKMYYDPNSKLYYDHDNGIYYFYDAERKSYLFHSQIRLPDKIENINEESVKKSNNVIELSDGEVNSDEDEVVCTDSCIRIIVVLSEYLDVGSLYIVTCIGGTIGRDNTNLIQIDEESVSKVHSKILYDKKDKAFFIQDCKTTNGTYINNERLADAHAESEPIEITHRDFLKIGSTTFSLHIHVGNETCAECEPGNIQAILEAKSKALEEENITTDLNTQRKNELKALRKRYGIKQGYIPKALIESIPDRAEKRRVNVGSEPYRNTFVPTAKASVHEEIPMENKGHKMLAKMGWKSGEGLGKSKSGITQPINVSMLERKKGLGSGTKTSLDNIATKSQKTKWEKAKERYDKLDKS